MRAVVQEALVGVGSISFIIAVAALVHGDWIAALALACFGVSLAFVAMTFDA